MLTQPFLFWIGLVVVFNLMNLDAKLVVAILGQDFALCCDLFSICDLCLCGLFWASGLISMPCSFWSYEPFLWAFGLVVSSLCCVVHRSKSPRNNGRPAPREPLPRRRSSPSYSSSSSSRFHTYDFGYWEQCCSQSCPLSTSMSAQSTIWPSQSNWTTAHSIYRIPLQWTSTYSQSTSNFTRVIQLEWRSIQISCCTYTKYSTYTFFTTIKTSQTSSLNQTT